VWLQLAQDLTDLPAQVSPNLKMQTLNTLKCDTESRNRRKQCNPFHS